MEKKWYDWNPPFSNLALTPFQSKSAKDDSWTSTSLQTKVKKNVD
jgi:hypothetical protein